MTENCLDVGKEWQGGIFQLRVHSGFHRVMEKGVPPTLLQAPAPTVTLHKSVSKSQRHAREGVEEKTYLKKLPVTKLPGFARCLIRSFHLGSAFIHLLGDLFWPILSELLLPSPLCVTIHSVPSVGWCLMKWKS